MTDPNRELQNAVQRALSAAAELVGDGATRATVRNIIRTAVDEAVKASTLPVGLSALMDGRFREWHLKAEFWRTEPSVSGYDSAELVLAGDTVEIGMERAAVWLRDGALHVFGQPLPDACQLHRLFAKLQTLRVSLSRGNGVARFRHKIITPSGKAAWLRGIVSQRPIPPEMKVSPLE